MHAVDPGEDLEGDDRVVVHRVAEGGTLLLADADDGEGALHREDLVADRVVTAEELLGDVVAEKDHGDGVRVFLLGEGAAQLDLGRLDVEHLGRDAADADAIDGGAPGADAPARPLLGSDPVDQRRLAAHGGHVAQIQILVAPPSPFPAFLVLDDAELVDAEDAGAQVAEGVGHVAVEPLDDRDDEDDRHHADDDAQQRQEGAQRVLDQRGKGNADSVSPSHRRCIPAPAFNDKSS
jgi:hypothetical protein